jgi:DNA-binding transcriptional MerR regulator
MTTNEGDMSSDTGPSVTPSSSNTGDDIGAPSGDWLWVPLRDAEYQTGVSVATLRKWRKKGTIPSRWEEIPTGRRVIVPLELVAELAIERGAGSKGVFPTPPAATSTETAAEPEPPQWAMELLSRADARAEHLLDRLAQAERERADAERDALIERHKREAAEAATEALRSESAALQSELDRLRLSPPRRRWWRRNGR